MTAETASLAESFLEDLYNLANANPEAFAAYNFSKDDNKYTIGKPDGFPKTIESYIYIPSRINENEAYQHKKEIRTFRQFSLDIELRNVRHKFFLIEHTRDIESNKQREFTCESEFSLHVYYKIMNVLIDINLPKELMDDFIKLGRYELLDFGSNNWLITFSKPLKERLI